MIKVTVYLGDIERAINFVKILDYFPQDMTLVGDNYCVNAKSLLGVLSTDLRQPVTLGICNRASEEEATVISALHEFIITEKRA